MIRLDIVTMSKLFYGFSAIPTKIPEDLGLRKLINYFQNSHENAEVLVWPKQLF
jgi:hypothetical protein